MLKRLVLISLAVVGFFAFICGAVVIDSAIERYRKEMAIQTDLNAQIAQYAVADPVLGAITNDEFGSKSDNWVLKQTVTYPGTDDKKIVKTVYNRSKMPHLHPYANFRLYEFFRPDGTKEREELYYPEAQLSSSVFSEKSVRFFDEKGTQTESRQVRPDGTVGAISKDNVHTEFRADGITKRSIQDYVEKTCRLTYFRLDGKTPWWVCLYENERKISVFFDLDGNPFEKSFVRKHLLDGYSAGPDTKPFAYFADIYKRPNGRDDYIQTWYVVWDKTTNSTREVLHHVEILDERGSVCKIVYLDITNTSRNITLVHEFNADGSIFSRKYRSPNCRESEKLRWPEDPTKAGVTSTFDEKDHFVEKIDQRILHGFHVDLYGLNDDDTHDK